MPEHPLLNFFDQLKIDNTYELFFPKKEQGLVIIWLYEKIKNKTFPNGIFKEADIQQAFQEISLLSREKIERNPWDHYNSHIMALQEFFLIYTVDFPAPFSPISACTVPGRSASCTLSRAFTPGKDLQTPFISSLNSAIFSLLLS